MSRSIKTELNRYLKSLDKAALEKEVKTLYSKFKVVKEYYELELGLNTAEVLESYKEKIKREYFPSRGFGRARSRESRKPITAFKKIATSQKDVVELLLYRVEMMLEFTRAYGDIDEPFYNSLEGSFYDACKLIQKEKLESYFKKECLHLIELAYPLGWGVQDTLQDYFDEFFTSNQ
ncbi:MAG: DUF6155 family protein [Bacteroidota bacterium]